MLVIDARPTQNEHRHRGIGRYVHGLCRALIADGTSAQQLLVHGDQPLSADLRGADLMESRRPHLLRYHGGWLADELLLPLASRGRWRLFHATDPDAVPDPLFVPTVATLYDLTPWRDPAVWRSMSFDQRLGYRRMLANVRRARAVVTISEAARDQIVATLGLSEDRVQVVYPGIDATSWRAAGGLPRSGLLFVGAPSPHKNLSVLLDALRRLHADDRPALTITGPWPAVHAEALRRSASVRELDVKLEPYADEGRLRELYWTSTALVMPSRWEGFGLPVLEAMSAGCPVVISTVPALMEVAGDAARVAPVDDPEALAATIAELLRDPAGQRRMAEAGVARASLFSWQRSAAAARAIYEAASGR